MAGMDLVQIAKQYMPMPPGSVLASSMGEQVPAWQPPADEVPQPAEPRRRRRRRRMATPGPAQQQMPQQPAMPAQPQEMM